MSEDELDELFKKSDEVNMAIVTEVDRRGREMAEAIAKMPPDYWAGCVVSMLGALSGVFFDNYSSERYSALDELKASVKKWAEVPFS